MKKLILLIMLATLFSCKKESKYRFTVTCSNGTGMSSSWYSIECDSVKMLSAKKALVYVDGSELSIEATNHISVGSNSRYKTK